MRVRCKRTKPRRIKKTSARAERKRKEVGKRNERNKIWGHKETGLPI